MIDASAGAPLSARRALLYGLLHCWRHRRLLLRGCWPMLAVTAAALAAFRLVALSPPSPIASGALAALAALALWAMGSAWLAVARHAAAAPWQASMLVWCRRWALWQWLAVLLLTSAWAWAAHVASRGALAWALASVAAREAASWLPVLAGIAAAACCGRAAAALACPSGFASGWRSARAAAAPVSLALAALGAATVAALLALRWLFVELNAWGFWEKSWDDLADAGWSALHREPTTVSMGVLRIAAFSVWLALALCLSAAVAGRGFERSRRPAS